MGFRDIFEELHWDFQSIMSVVLYFLGTHLFQEENATEKDTQQSLSEDIMNKNLKNISLDEKDKKSWKRL